VQLQQGRQQLIEQEDRHRPVTVYNTSGEYLLTKKHKPTKHVQTTVSNNPDFNTYTQLITVATACSHASTHVKIVD